MRRAAAAGFAATVLLASGAAASPGAPSAARQFELVVLGRHELVPASPAFPFGIRHTGTFTATVPFCSSGTFFDLTNDLLNSSVDSRLYTCADGSGTLTTEQEDWFEHKPPYTSTWRILGGTGRYADLRGRGAYRGEILTGDTWDADPLTQTYRCTYRGQVDFDSVGPAIGVASAKLTKLQQAAGSYSLRLALSLHDNERGNRISYVAAVEPAGGGLYLVEQKGSTAPGTITMKLRFRPSPGARTVVLQLGAEDPLGNARWISRRLKLPT